MFFAVIADVARIEALGQNEIGLQGAALPFAADRVAQHEIELRAIEGAVAGVHFILDAGLFGGRAQGFLGAIPHRIGAGADLGPVGEADEHILEAEIAINAERQLTESRALGVDLVDGAENMGVVLGEAAHPHQPMQGA